MSTTARFEQPADYKLILRDSFEDNTFYGLDEFDIRYLNVIKAKFGCQHSFHTIPDRVKMELAKYIWNDKRQKYVLNDAKTAIVQINRLENMVISHTFRTESLFDL